MTISLQRVDSVEIITLVDNVIENEGSRLHENVLPVHQWVSGENTTPNYTLAGHGLSTLIRTRYRDRTFEVLYDTGPSRNILLHNVRVLGLDLSFLDSIVISHGHWDHMGGLTFILAQIQRQGIPVYLHPRMLDKRRIVAKIEQGERIRELPSVCSASDIEAAGGNPIITKEPILIGGNTILRSGEIPRRTEYEKGFPNHEALIDGEWKNDAEIIDDNIIIIKTKEGLIIITGCAHAGIVNSVYEAIRLTGEDNVQAILGGFHLGGKQNESRIESTIKNLQDISPSIIVPCHCTGAVAQHMMAKAFPEAYVTSSVGNLYRF